MSIADLFAAGIVPALLMTRGADGHRLASWRAGAATASSRSRACARCCCASSSALPGLLLVALIFVGIRAGIFTAVESAAIAVVYALLVTSAAVPQADLREFLDTVRRCGAHHRR